MLWGFWWTTLHFSSHREINCMGLSYKTGKNEHGPNGICSGYILTTVTDRKTEVVLIFKCGKFSWWCNPRFRLKREISCSFMSTPYFKFDIPTSYLRETQTHNEVTWYVCGFSLYKYDYVCYRGEKFSSSSSELLYST